MRFFGVLALAAVAGSIWAEEAPEVLDIAPVWAGHPVGFCLLTKPPHQFVAYYDAERRMTVASRTLDENAWHYTVLPSSVVWDSHNSLVMALDAEGYLHLSGNMHVVPLVYFRSEKPLDAASLAQVPHMIGTEEDRVTYPQFLEGPNGQFLYTYRDGKSGSGNQIYNVYDLEKKAWRRLLDTPLTDGHGGMNAYFNPLTLGPDGYYHLVWVWRNTPDCATNHDPMYARSKDLVHWERSNGEALTLPMTIENGEIVDPVPPGGGIINGNVRLGFDAQQRPIVSYHKYDEKGITQLYNARMEDGVWKAHQSSDWDYRWEFSGGGTIPFEVHVEGVKLEKDGSLTQGWGHSKYGSQRWRLDPETLRPVERVEVPKKPVPAGLHTLLSDFPGMQVNVRNDIGSPGTPGLRYCIRWETLGPNRDKPRPEPWPGPSMLQLYRIQE